MEIPRCITGSTDSVSTELHLFSDASEVGYGAVAYLCIVDENDIRQCQLIFSKARVAPIKSVSVPRLEHSAAVLSVRVYCLLKDSGFVNFSNVFFWTDSSIVLYYVNNVSSRFSTFVSNRLTKILVLKYLSGAMADRKTIQRIEHQEAHMDFISKMTG